MDSEDQDYKEYSRQLHQLGQNNQIGIYYKFRDAIIQNEHLRDSLFNEFLSSEKVPSKYLFLRHYVSDEEWADSRLIDSRSEDPAVRKKANDTEEMVREKVYEFDMLNAKGSLDKSFYYFDIYTTATVKILHEVSRKLDILKKLVTNNNYSSHEIDAEVFANSIIVILKKFKNSLWLNEIANEILDDDDNGFVDIMHWQTRGQYEKEAYGLLKEHLNFHLRNRLLSLSVTGADEVIKPVNRKRVNTEARDKHSRVLEKYDKYIKDGHNHNASIDKLAHDFRLEYAPENSNNRKSQLKRIIRTRNKEKQ